MLADWLGCGAWSAGCVTLSQPSSEQGTAQELDLVFSSPQLPAGPGVSDGELLERRGCRLHSESESRLTSSMNLAISSHFLTDIIQLGSF